MARLGKLPAVEDCIRIGNVLISVDAMEGRRIETLCLKLDQDSHDAQRDRQDGAL